MISFTPLANDQFMTIDTARTFLNYPEQQRRCPVAISSLKTIYIYINVLLYILILYMQTYQPTSLQQIVSLESGLVSTDLLTGFEIQIRNIIYKVFGHL